MKRVVIVGCGVVGAAIAYELSQCPDVDIAVVDQQAPASGSTGAALGVAMAVISQKVKGRNWKLREQSWQRFQTLLPELEAATGQRLQRNTQGILSLCFEAEDMPRWQSLQTIRQGQGYVLELWSPEQIAQRCPHLEVSRVVSGIYSPQDLQVNPTQFTQALVAAATAQGVVFHLGEPVVDFKREPDGSLASTSQSSYRCTAVITASQTLAADWVVLAAGLGTTPLAQSLKQPLPLAPVLGQGLQLHLEQPLGNPEFQPVVNGNDIHVVPLGLGDYWVGATVEFPPQSTAEDIVALQPQAERLQAVLEGAIAYCPGLAQGSIRHRWFGLRPRPQGQAAPVIQPLPGYTNVWLATGHYRNGVLLAPATALAVRDQWLQRAV